jgi:hypothetical protein
MDRSRYYVVYRFKDKVDYENPANIYTITPDSTVAIAKGKKQARKRYKYAVTSLDRLYNESKPVRAKSSH